MSPSHAGDIAQPTAPPQPAPAAENVRVEPIDEPGRPDEPADAGAEVGRALWAITTVVFLVAAVILLVTRRNGYAAVTFAVALSAAINVF